ncbi:MAG: nitrate reductase cytochrome c-type subunit [Kofleriaceae bacterium]
MSGQRGLHIGLVVAATVATVGLLSGVESSGREVSSYLPARPAASTANPGNAASASRSYRDMRETMYGPNAALSDLWWQHLRQVPIAATVLAPATEEERAAALARRAARRAYDGAPPIIPHEIDQLAAPACLTCHDRGVSLAGVFAPRMSHEPRASCVQCHVAARGSPEGLAAASGPGGPDARTFAGWQEETAFVGLAAPLAGSRAWPGAPPMIPHTTWMRERCASCHGPAGVVGLRTPHPWRQSCTQCHAPSAWLDQRAPVALGAPGASP